MPGSLTEALLLVDGYNIIGAWPSLKKLRDRHGLDPARQKLIETLINFTCHQGYETQVVFDAQYQKTSSSCETFTPSLSVRYTAFAQTADTYIERLCATFEPQPSLARLIVATSDETQRRVVVGYGAECISALRLLSEVNSVISKIKSTNPSTGSLRSGRYLASSLSPQAKAILDQWVGRNQ